MRTFGAAIEVIPGLLLGGVNDVDAMIRKKADVLVPLAFLKGDIWDTGFRGEILYYPIRDMGVLPEDVLEELVDRICRCLDEGKKVGLFCGAGHGRTGYVAACVLARRGIEDPVSYLRQHYSNQAVESEEQYRAITHYIQTQRQKGGNNEI